MPRATLVLLLVLTVASLLLMGKTLSLNAGRGQIGSGGQRAERETARLFYGAINQVLETGNEWPLTALLSSGYTGHVAHETGAETRAGLLLRLHALRAQFPNLRIRIGELSTSAGTVVAEISTADEAGEATDVVPAGFVNRTGSFEVLRIEGALVAERWSSSVLAARLREVAGMDVHIPANRNVELRMERLAFGPNGMIELRAERDLMVVGESGFTSLHNEYQAARPDEFETFSRTEPVDAHKAASTDAYSLRPDDTLTISANSRIRLSSTGSGSTVLLISLVVPSVGPVAIADQTVFESLHMIRTLVAAHDLPPAQEPDSQVELHLGSIDLGPGVRIARSDGEGTEIVSVIAGVLDVEVIRGSVTWVSPGKSLVTVDDEQRIHAGESFQASSGTMFEYRAGIEGPATLWIVTVSAG